MPRGINGAKKRINQTGNRATGEMKRETETIKCGRQNGEMMFQLTEVILPEITNETGNPEMKTGTSGRNGTIIPPA